jgi:predicted transcriptional regulator
MTFMKTAISLSDSLYRAANRLARRLGISRSEVFQRALSAYVNAHEDAGVTAALDDVYPEGGETGRLDRALERLQAASLPKEDW